MPNSRIKKDYSGAIVKSLASVVILTLVVLLAVTILQKPSGAKFDAEKWADPKLVEHKPYIRLSMIADLTENYITRGQGKAEVLELLGEPTDTEYFADHDLIYWLGPHQTMFTSVDSVWLVIDFGEADEVIDYQVISD